eukprot:GEMP01021128.1.p1 GENE.GEMP01021128.1~~GEMP01021128.1.p1  ORF type:complete len:267 (-),score=38.31 GEMP01021128.1:1338-2138(-)
MDVDFSISYLTHLLHVARDCIRYGWSKSEGSDSLELTLRAKELHNKPLDERTIEERRAHVLEILKTYDGNASTLEQPVKDIRKNTKKVFDLSTNNPVVGPATPLPRARESTGLVLTPNYNWKRRLSSVKANAQKVQEEKANKRQLQERRDLHNALEDQKRLVPLIDSLLRSPIMKKRIRNSPINFDSLVNKLWLTQNRQLAKGAIRKALEKLISAYPSWIDLRDEKDRLIRYRGRVQVRQVLEWLDDEEAQLPPLEGRENVALRKV